MPFIEPTDTSTRLINNYFLFTFLLLLFMSSMSYVFVKGSSLLPKSARHMLGISMSSSTSSFSTFGIGTPPIQLIHDSLCSLGDKTSVVAEDPLSSSVVRECMNAMEKVTLKDIGVTRSIVNKVKDPCCMTISENDDFTFAVFFVPAGRTLPTHDHPNMCVLSHVMHGSLRVRSFSPLQDADAGAIANATARHH